MACFMGFLSTINGEYNIIILKIGLGNKNKL